MSTSQAEAFSYIWAVRGRRIDLRRRTLVMGILNVTPDSFSDGGRFLDADAAVQQAAAMVAEGADIIDIGAESTRPGRAEAMDAELEWERLQPVLAQVRQAHPDMMISVDTYRHETAARALDAGTDIINDIYGLNYSPAIAGECARHGAGLVLMHMKGTPETMQQEAQYSNLLAEIRDSLRRSTDTAIAAGLPEECIAVDPGIGFAKTADHNVEVLAGLEYLRLLQRPICVGASRKSFLGKLTGDLPPEEREEATIAAHCAAVLQGAAIVRTHNVQGARRSLAVIDAIRASMDL